MGIGNWLMGLGFKAETLATRAAVRGGSMPLQWPVGATDSFIYRLPRDPQRRASIFSTSQAIIVNEGETAVVLEDGRSVGTLDPGRYVFEKQRVVGSLDVVWVRTRQQPIRWGVGNVSSFDGIDISANGELYVRVGDAEAFFKEAVQAAATLSEKDLQRLLVPRISRVLTSLIARTEARAIQLQQDTFEEGIKEKLTDRLGDLGLSLVSFEMSNVVFPPEFRAAWGGAARASLDNERLLIEAQGAAQVKQLEAMAEAQAKLSTGMVDVQLLTAMQQQGIDPLKLKALEAMQAMAENPGQGGFGDAARTQLIGQFAASTLAAPPLQPPVHQITQHVPAPQPTAPPPASDPIAEIEQKLNELADKLEAGEISESVYEKLSARLERKLERLGG